MTAAWSGNPVRWRGLASYQLISDLWRYHELLVERRPDFVLETGSGEGGTTAFLEDVCKLQRHGQVIGIEGDSLLAAKRIREHVRGASVMAILDSDVYNAAHMLAELFAYAPLVTVDQTLIVCHTDRPDWGSAPALARYLEAHPSEFEKDEEPLWTLNPGGYLRRVRNGKD